MSVVDYVRPEVFDELKDEAERDFGFEYCASGPMVRSSYKAGEFYLANLLKKRAADPAYALQVAEPLTH